MNIELRNPELTEFIQGQVATGSFATNEAVVEYALMLMMADGVELSQEDLDDIELSRLQIERGEFVEFDEWASRIRRRYGISAR